MNVKICGIMDSIIGEQVARLGPDYMGYVFANSRRQVSPEQAASIIQHIKQQLSEPPQMVGVYSHIDRTIVEPALSKAQLDIVQFHADSDLSVVNWIKEHYDTKIWLTIPISSVMPVGEQARSQIVQAQLERLLPIIQHIDAVLLDTHNPQYGGGTGQGFQWDVIPSYTTWLNQMSLPLYVAGGLHVGNVGELIENYNVAGVDVSSGVESNGIKDIHKVTSFIERVRML